MAQNWVQSASSLTQDQMKNTLWLTEDRIKTDSRPAHVLLWTSDQGLWHMSLKSVGVIVNTLIHTKLGSKCACLNQKIWSNTNYIGIQYTCVLCAFRIFYVRVQCSAVHYSSLPPVSDLPRPPWERATRQQPQLWLPKGGRESQVIGYHVTISYLCERSLRSLLGFLIS